jgi:hypothetical protein
VNLPCKFRIIEQKRRGSRKYAARRGTVLEECRIGNAWVPSNQFTPTFFLSLIPDYVNGVYPVNPVIAAEDIQDHVGMFEIDRESTSFLYAFAAVTINLTRTRDANETKEQILHLLDRAIGQIDPMRLNTRPSVFKLMRSIFIEVCLLGMGKPTLAFSYLRDAISMLYLLGIDKPDVMEKHSVFRRAQLQRAYWECFIHERFTALTQFKPVCLYPLRLPLESDPGLDPGIEQGWTRIIETFLLVDFEFVDFWINDSSAPRLSAGWIVKKHEQLADQNWSNNVSLLSDLQRADHIITRQWLRTLTWELAIKNMLLSSDSRTESLSLALPLRLSRDLRIFLGTMSLEAVGVHGSGILHKLFEITDNIANIIMNLRGASREDTLGRVEDILFLKKFIFSFPRIDEMHRDSLLEKFLKIQIMFPEMKEIEQLF